MHLRPNFSHPPVRRPGHPVRTSEGNMSLREVPNLRAKKPAPGARIIVVSNRLPLTLKKTEHGWETARSSGGLASAMNPLLGRTGGEWIGWAGDGDGGNSQERQAILSEWAATDHCYAVDLPDDVAAGFYQGYANQTLWPVFHNFPSQLKFDARHWES